MSTVVSFPNINIGPLTLNPVAFSLFGINVRWYGLIIVTGIILAFAYASYRGRKNEAMTSDDMIDYFIYTVLFAIIGARAYYVITSLEQYDSFWETLQIWNGGLAIYGAIIAGGLTIYVVSKAKKKNFLRAFDMVAPAVMIGQIIGRWGNFFNGEAFGDIEKFEFFGLLVKTPTVNTLPWVMRVKSYASDYEEVFAHPTFLYESLWNIVGFLIINSFYKKKKFHGQIFFMYIGWYGFGRMIIEGFRSDSLYVGNVKISQLIGLVCFIVSVAMMIFIFTKKGKTVFGKLYVDRAEISAQSPDSQKTSDYEKEEIKENSEEIKGDK